MVVVGIKGYSVAHFIFHSHLYISNYNEWRITKGREARTKVGWVKALIWPCAASFMPPYIRNILPQICMEVKGTPKWGNYNVMFSPGAYFDAPFVARFGIFLLYVSTTIKFPSHTHDLHICSFSFTPLPIPCLYLYFLY